MLARLVDPVETQQQEAIQNLKREAGRITEAIQMIENGNLKDSTLGRAETPLATLYGMRERDNWLLGSSPSNSHRHWKFIFLFIAIKSKK